MGEEREAEEKSDRIDNGCHKEAVVQRRKEITPTVLKAMNLPEEFWDYRKADLPAELVSRLASWVTRWEAEDDSHPREGLFLHGDYLLAEKALAVLLMFVRRRMFHVYTLSATQLAKAVIDDGQFDRLTTVSLLGLYDFGAEYRDKSGFIESNMANVFAERKKRKRPTVVASHISPEILKLNYGVFISDSIVGAMFDVDVRSEECRST